MFKFFKRKSAIKTNDTTVELVKKPISLVKEDENIDLGRKLLNYINNYNGPISHTINSFSLRNEDGHKLEVSVQRTAYDESLRYTIIVHNTLVSSVIDVNMQAIIYQALEKKYKEYSSRMEIAAIEKAKQDVLNFIK